MKPSNLKLGSKQSKHTVSVTIDIGVIGDIGTRTSQGDTSGRSSFVVTKSLYVVTYASKSR
jgi:hypothetical protein